MVRCDIVAAKVGRADAWIRDASLSLLGPRDDYLADPQRRDLALFYLFLAIQECIDLGARWVADAGWGEPDDAASARPASAFSPGRTPVAPSRRLRAVSRAPQGGASHGVRRPEACS